MGKPLDGANIANTEPGHRLSVTRRSEDAPLLRISLLGGFTISLGERVIDASAWRLRKAQNLVKLLALAPNHRMHRERMLDLLWPDLDLDAAANNLHYTMHAARATLAQLWAPVTSEGHLTSGRLLLLHQQMLSLNSAVPLWVDVEAFEAAAAAARHSADSQLYEAALDLYSGDLLPDDQYEDWASPRRGASRTTYLALLLAVATSYITTGKQAEAIEAFQRLLAAEPAHEEAHRQLMRLYAHNGQRHFALRQYDWLREALQRELGIPPSPESRQLYDDILAGRLAAEPKAPVISLVSSAPPAPTHTPTHITSVTGERSLAPRPVRLPLIGRQDALTRLREVWNAAIQEPQALLIKGEAGIGKSRLAEEALAWAADRIHDDGKHDDGTSIRTAMSRCSLADGGLPFGPVVSWLRSSALWPGVLALDEIWQSEVSRVVPELMIEHSQLSPPIALPENLQRPRLFEALARAVTQSSHPLLLVIDDLQWCEQETLAWLCYLLRRPTSQPLLIIGTVRAEEVTPEHPLAGLIADLRRAQQLTEIILEPLDAAETAALGMQVAGHPLDAEQAKQLYAETEGHPLFGVEMIRAGLIDAPAGQEKAGGNSESGVSRLPPTMLGVLERRLGQLSPEAYELASLAAVVGRAFSADLLVEASRPAGRDEESALRALEELERRRIIREQGAGSYDFSHDKFREVAYTTLNAARRRALHRRVARGLEVIAADVLDEVTPQLAMHYERGGETAKAAMALERAGILAVERGLLPLARSYINRAITLATLGDQMRCYEELGDSYWLFGAFYPYRTALGRWRQLTPEAQDPLVGARLLRKLLYVWMRSDVLPEPDPEDLRAMAIEAQALAERAGDEDEIQRVRVASLCLAWRLAVLPRVAEAEDVRGGRTSVLAAVDHLATRGDWIAFQHALDAYSTCLLDVGKLTEALEIVQLRLRAPNIPPQEYGDIVAMLGRIYYAMGDYEHCIANICEAYALSRSDVPLLIGMPWYGAGAVSISGNWNALDAIIAASVRTWEESGRISPIPLASYWSVLHVGLAHEDRAAFESAATHLRVLIDWWPEKKHLAAVLAAYIADDPTPILRTDPLEEWVIGVEIIALMFCNERGIPAPRFLMNAAVNCAETQFYDCAMPLIHVAEAVASADPAQLAAAIEDAEKHKLVPHAARLRIVLAQRTGDRRHLERARPVLKQLGDRQFLRRLEAVAATLR